MVLYPVRERTKRYMQVVQYEGSMLTQRTAVQYPTRVTHVPGQTPCHVTCTTLCWAGKAPVLQAWSSS
jgi:hypothetical protein